MVHDHDRKNIARRWAPLLAVALLVAAAVSPAAAEPDGSGPDDTIRLTGPDPAAGEALYRSRCASCHGADGRGDGPVARFLDPRPRDFTRGVFKIRSTESGSPPTARDLLRTIRNGLPGTGMPAFAALSPEELRRLVAYIRSLSPRFREEDPGEVIPIPRPSPPPSPESIARGEAVYRRMKCDDCHGPTGRGDGPSARTLRDDHGRRIFPFDMTRGWKLKGGTSPEDIYRTFHTGLDGTPMPSYHESITEQESWELVHFVRSLFIDD
jgi:mono/diheme cytochrome c family protein